jgi:hypothetical protein
MPDASITAAPCQRCLAPTTYRVRVSIACDATAPATMKAAAIVCLPCADLLVAAWYREMAAGTRVPGS